MEMSVQRFIEALKKFMHLQKVIGILRESALVQHTHRFSNAIMLRLMFLW